MSQNFRKWEKSVTFLICVRQSFFAIYKVLIEIDAGYDFCVFSNMRFKRGHKKKRKLDNQENYRT